MELSDSNNASLSVYVFPCGDGDTVLLHLPTNGWVLIDCNLPKRNGIYDQFVMFLREKGVERFDAVVLSHADQDHLLGMGDLLRKYARKHDGRPTLFIDGGLDPKELEYYYEDRAGKSSYDKLRVALDDLEAVGDIEVRSVGDTSYPIPVGSGDHCIELLPIAPSHAKQRKQLRLHLGTLSSDARRNILLNDCSLILVVRQLHHTCWNVLLTGDAGTSSLDDALDHWVKLSGNNGNSCKIRFLKIPHHGSSSSLSRKLIESIDSFYEGDCVAAVSAGDGFPNPNSEVLKQYLEEGWVTLHTHRRTKTVSRPCRGIELAGRKGSQPQPIPSPGREVIRVNLEVDTGRLQWQPQSLQIVETDLPFYTRPHQQ